MEYLPGEFLNQIIAHILFYRILQRKLHSGLATLREAYKSFLFQATKLDFNSSNSSIACS